MSRTAFARLTAAVSVLALCVVLLGAYVRLSDAGLGCADWPSCYGRLVVPESPQAVEQASQAHPLHAGEAWKEMAHRDLGWALGLAIAVVAVLAWRDRERGRGVVLPTVLVALVVLEALIGIWAVTLRANATIVAAHLIGGMATLALLWWVTLREGRWWSDLASAQLAALRPWAIGAVVLVVVQTLLGGWTSTHYAAIACNELPTCRSGDWWPPADFLEGFVPWQTLGVGSELGTLDSPARTAIHLAHRTGALIVLVYVGALAWAVVRRSTSAGQRRLGFLLALVLAAQIALGVTNVLGRLPLPVAVVHTGGAVALLLALLTVLHVLTSAVRPAAPWARRR
jgi:cytochrome c oxidase assembly protein subunit 15